MNAFETMKDICKKDEICVVYCTEDYKYLITGSKFCVTVRKYMLDGKHEIKQARRICYTKTDNQGFIYVIIKGKKARLGASNF